MTVYALRNDFEKYQDLDYEILDILNAAPEGTGVDNIVKFSIHNTAMKSWWKAPHTQFIKNEGAEDSVIPEICCWNDATLVLSPKAYRLLGDMLSHSGELLPVIVGDDTYYIFNCLEFGEEDEEKCRFEYIDGERYGIEYLEFTSGVEEKLVFKSKLESCVTLFCSERFKEIVMSYGLAGLVFDKNLIQVFE